MDYFEFVLVFLAEELDLPAFAGGELEDGLAVDFDVVEGVVVLVALEDVVSLVGLEGLGEVLFLLEVHLDLGLLDLELLDAVVQELVLLDVVAVALLEAADLAEDAESLVLGAGDVQVLLPLQETYSLASQALLQMCSFSSFTSASFSCEYYTTFSLIELGSCSGCWLPPNEM